MTKKSQSKQCQNCHTNFTIEPEDFEFYEKIGVPAPTFCWECRMQRRMASWNERKLYSRKCDLCKQPMVSIYAKDKPFPVYCGKCWWSDKWDPMEYGMDYDFNRPFFEQYGELQKKVPVINLLRKKAVNSDYCHDALEVKDCYLFFLGGIAENVSYTTYSGKSKDCFDNYKVVGCEMLYDCFYCFNSYNLLYSQHCQDCYNSAFLFNCRNCKDCFGCVNLKHKQYYIFNKSYTKREYEKEIKKYDLSNYDNVRKLKDQFRKFTLKFPRKYARIENSVNASGDSLIRVKNCHYVFDSEEGTENCKYGVIGGWNTKDAYDFYDEGYFINCCYDSVCIVERCNTIAFSIGVWASSNVQYGDSCHNSADLFGCISLKKKKYCILNKEYNKEEYEKLLRRIKEQMMQVPYRDKQGRVYKYGEYFPVDLSRACYNESVANQYYPLSKVRAIEKGFLWKEEEKAEHKETIKIEDMPSNINEVKETILGQVIPCENGVNNKCMGAGAFRLILPELEFYKKLSIPVPRLCPECRHKERFDLKNLIKLHNRTCQCAGVRDDSGKYANVQSHHHKDGHCKNEFETTYAPDRPEIVYCEKCYQKEVE